MDDNQPQDDANDSNQINERLDRLLDLLATYLP